jgi:hypothetical protein
MTAGSVIWLAAGLGVGLLHALSIVFTVIRVSEGGIRHVPLDVAKGYIARYVLALLVMAVAVRDSVVACALVALGIVLGRWLFVLLHASGRTSWLRAPGR